MSVKIQLRRDLAANWASATVLASGEVGYETDTGNIKIGDGTTQWGSLAYYQLPNVSVNPATTADLNNAAYRVMGRYRLNSVTSGSTFTNGPSDLDTADADSYCAMIVTSHAYTALSTLIQQTLTQFSGNGTTLKQWVRMYDGTNYTAWTSTAHLSDSEVTTAKIANDAVTADKLADDAATDANRAVTTNHIRDGAITTQKIADDAVTFTKIQNSAAAGLSVVGRSANSAGDFAEINAANDAEVLRRSGTAVGFGTIATAGIANDAVTYSKIQNVSATDRLLGRSTAGAGDIEEITCTAAGRALLDDADAAAQRTTLDVRSQTELETAGGVGSLALVLGDSANNAVIIQIGSSITNPAVTNTAVAKLVRTSATSPVQYSGAAITGGVLFGGAGAVWKCLSWSISNHNPGEYTHALLMVRTA
jgi:hypothetical protein